MIIDLYLFNLINGWAGRWLWLDSTAIFFAIYAEYVLLGCLIMVLALDVKKYWRMVAEAFIAAILVRFVLVEIFYWLYFRWRPFIGSQAHLLIPYDSYQTSFPSGHASFYFALSTIIYGYHRRLGIFFYGISLFIVFARVFVGVHWPFDVVAGAIIGVLMGLMLNYIFKHISFSYGK